MTCLYLLITRFLIAIALILKFHNGGENRREKGPKLDPESVVRVI